MKGEYIEKGMSEIVEGMKKELVSKASALGAGQKTADKAYKMCIGILEQAEKMVSMNFSDVPFDEKYYSVRESRVFDNPAASYFDEYREWYENETDTGAKEGFLVYAHAVQMVRSAFYDKKAAELERAEQHGNAERVFECRMIVGTLQALLDKWAMLWASETENGNGR